MSMQKERTTSAKTADANVRRSLDHQYGDIGISAVAAALPYAGEAKKRDKQPDGSSRGSDSRKRSVLAV